MSELPFGPLGGPRRPCQWAQLHAGIEFISPARDRQLMWFRTLGYDNLSLGVLFGIDELEVERAIGRVTRTLTTWERNASRYAHRYVAQEPSAQGGTDKRGPTDLADAARPKTRRPALRGRSL